MSYKVYKVPHNFGAHVAYTYEIRKDTRPAPLNSKLIRWNCKSYDSARQAINRLDSHSPWKFTHKSRPLGEPEPITQVYFIDNAADYLAIKLFLDRERRAPILRHDNLPHAVRQQGYLKVMGRYLDLELMAS